MSGSGGGIQVLVTRAEGGEDLELPAYQSAHASGLDLQAAVRGELVIEPGKVALVSTGLLVAIPPGYELQVRPRSGLAAKHGVTVLNAPGTIDADFRGEVRVILINLGPEPFPIRRGMRIAQAVLARVHRVCWQEVTELPSSGRGEGGFGHTGV